MKFALLYIMRTEWPNGIIYKNNGSLQYNQNGGLESDGVSVTSWNWKLFPFCA